VGLLDLVAWRGADRADQERMLTQFARLATDAAASAIQVGDPELAVELLEQGRGVLLTQALDARSSYSVLREAAPDLADRLARIHEVLERPLTQAAVDLDPDRAASALRRQADQRNELARQRDALVDEIRTLPGFTDFLRPPRSTTLRTAATDGAVVIVNISRYRCDALILTAAGVHLTPLDQLTSQEVFQRVVAFVDALYAFRQPEAVIDEQRDRQLLEARRTIIGILAWMWDTICAPVLTDLGLTGRPQSGQGWPRIWWCPTGLLTFLPLHAAGRHATRNAGCPATVLDRTVSSYTPTLRMLLHTRERTIPAGTSHTRPLVVAMPTTPGQPDLPAASREAADFATRFPASEQLIGPTATRGAVLNALTRCPWAHFACHGAQDISAPSQGQLRLYDGPLTIRELTGRQLDHAELAFLSACETFRGGVNLADEAITVAAAMQLAGYRHVIGSLWSIADSLAPDIASSVYADLTRLHPARIDAGMTAAALHSAVQALRDRLPHAPTLWAQYLHIGP
jgi:hypothetical protein